MWQIDAIGGARFDDGAGGDNEVQRTMLEIVNQLDGFDSRGNIKVRFCAERWRVALHARCRVACRVIGLKMVPDSPDTASDVLSSTLLTSVGQFG